ncbi:MAG: hypothetical protein HY304_05070 [candidate division Zixibacteria bacterium]|nr:hypothetical protein [candidate division Zixibacteria bacterium]
MTFVTAELVYLNGGRAEGLFVGARPTVWRGDQKIVDLEVRHLAEHSSACLALGASADVRIGDLVGISLSVDHAADTAITTGSPPSVPHPDDRDRSKEPSPSLAIATTHAASSGAVAIQYSHWDDRSDANLDFAQGRVDVNLRVEDLWTPGLSFVVRSSGQQDRRAGLSGGQSDDSWTSRIATFSLAYRRADSRLEVSAGRINPARVGATGQLDGASGEYQVTNQLHLGAFAGANAQWQYSEHRPDLQTYGVYANVRRGTARELLFDQTISVLGQYHGRVTSREAVFSQGRISMRGRWSLSHSVEVDVNRGWRKLEAGESISLSSIFAQGQVHLSRALAATLTWDTRKSFRSYESRNVADSLFDDRVRRGVRVQVDVLPSTGLSLSGGAGTRSAGGGVDRTRSYNAAARKQGLWNSRSNISVQYSVFQGKNTDGSSWNAVLGQGIRQRHWISLGTGIYRYTPEGQSQQRVNRRIDLTLRVAIGRHLTLNGLGQLNGGDDTQGRRVETGLTFQL